MPVITFCILAIRGLLFIVFNKFADGNIFLKFVFLSFLSCLSHELGVLCNVVLLFNIVWKINETIVVILLFNSIRRASLQKSLYFQWCHIFCLWLSVIITLRLVDSLYLQILGNDKSIVNIGNSVIIFRVEVFLLINFFF